MSSIYMLTQLYYTFNPFTPATQQLNLYDICGSKYREWRAGENLFQQLSIDQLTCALLTTIVFFNN